MSEIIYGLITLTVIAFIIFGVRACVNAPPERVVNRYTAIEHRTSSCGKNCTTTYPVTVYKFVSERGAVCDVHVTTYWATEKGTLVKCIQLFGWHGGRKHLPEAATW